MRANVTPEPASDPRVTFRPAEPRPLNPRRAPLAQPPPSPSRSTPAEPLPLNPRRAPPAQRPLNDPSTTPAKGRPTGEVVECESEPEWRLLSPQGFRVPTPIGLEDVRYVVLGEGLVEHDVGG
jgi:hypothetical protein